MSMDTRDFFSIMNEVIEFLYRNKDKLDAVIGIIPMSYGELMANILREGSDIMVETALIEATKQTEKDAE